jgi:hypothetical protein
MDHTLLILIGKQSKHIKSLQFQINTLKREIRELRENREWTAVELANYDWKDLERQSCLCCAKK